MKLMYKEKTASALMYRGVDVLDSIRCPRADVVFGVCWHYGAPSPQLERLTPETDPWHLVTDTVTEEPSAAQSDTSGRSPFDGFMPWMGMEEYNIVGSQVMYKRGDPRFSRTEYDTMVYIPYFWYAVREDAEGQRLCYYVSAKPAEGMDLHPGSGKFVGRYPNAAGGLSISRQPAETGHTRKYFRGLIADKGAGWSQVDIRVWSAVNLLFLVEYATWNAQQALGDGICAGSVVNNGGTDSLGYVSGRPAQYGEHTRPDRLPVQYRGIENWYGNLRQYMDGVNVYKREVYLCTDPALYKDFTAEDYVDTGIRLPENGGIRKFGHSEAFPWAFLPVESYAKGSGGYTDYVSDSVLSAADGPSDSGGWAVQDFGGDWYRETECGPWAFFAEGGVDFWPTSLTSRSVFDPALA